jgi:hypothetical protein
MAGPCGYIELAVNLSSVTAVIVWALINTSSLVQSIGKLQTRAIPYIITLNLPEVKSLKEKLDVQKYWSY